MSNVPMGQSERLTASSHFVRVLLQQADKLGLDGQKMLQKAGISTELAQQPQARITTHQLAHFIQLMWYGLQDETLGFYADRTKIGTFFMMGQLAIHAPTLDKALRLATRFYTFVTDDYSFRLVRKGEQASLIYAPVNSDNDRDHLIVEFSLIVWHRFASWLIGKHIPLIESQFTYPTPPHVDEYKFMFPCSHEFDQGRNSITFSSQYLKLPIVQGEEDLKVFISRSPVDVFLKPRNDESFSTRIRLMIEPLVAEGFPDFDSVADSMHMTSQTLRRKLKTEGSSYQQIKDLVRRDLAIYHLTRQSLAVAEISRLVGFTEPGAFIRAFKNWTGVTPGDYRQCSDE